LDGVIRNVEAVPQYCLHSRHVPIEIEIAIYLQKSVVPQKAMGVDYGPLADAGTRTRFVQALVGGLPRVEDSENFDDLHRAIIKHALFTQERYLKRQHSQLRKPYLRDKTQILYNKAIALAKLVKKNKRAHC